MKEGERYSRSQTQELIRDLQFRLQTVFCLKDLLWTESKQDGKDCQMQFSHFSNKTTLNSIKKQDLAKVYVIVERVNSNSITKPSESGTLVSNMNQHMLMWPHQISMIICHNGHNSIQIQCIMIKIQIWKQIKCLIIQIQIWIQIQIQSIILWWHQIRYDDLS